MKFPICRPHFLYFILPYYHSSGHQPAPAGAWATAHTPTQLLLRHVPLHFPHSCPVSYLLSMPVNPAPITAPASLPISRPLPLTAPFTNYLKFLSSFMMINRKPTITNINAPIINSISQYPIINKLANIRTPNNGGIIPLMSRPR